jgi:pimeloyl-ACP methyl ester carboxylesterase
LRWLAAVTRRILPLPIAIYAFFFESTSLKQLHGEGYLVRFLDEYIGDINSSPQHTANYIRLFQELDAHSLYHLLRRIDQPTLIVSGLLDILTPAYQSFELARYIFTNMIHSRIVIT